MKRIIDVHGHLGEYALFHNPKNSADDLVRRLDSMGIERLILSSNPAFASDYKFGNDLTADAVKRHTGRLFGYVVANPNYSDETEEEFNRCLTLPGFVGVKLHPSTHNYPLDGEGYRPALQFAIRRNLPVLIHFWFTDSRCGEAAVRKVMKNFPALRLILAHFGGPDNAFKALPQLYRDFPTLNFDTACSRSPKGIIEFLVKEGLENALLYGSDMPFYDPGSQLGKVEFSSISEEVRLKILSENAVKLFNW
ncbi:MAG: amidohydrolase family protein [Fibrobacteres bacterium]|nr:amidohydrolase family protein [Fibrobacterota bacterium]